MPFFRSTFFVFYLTYISQFSFGQSIEQDVDSLYQVFSDETELRRGKHVIKFVVPYFSSEPEKALQYIQEIERRGLVQRDTIVLINCNALYAEYHWRKSDYKSGIEFGMKAIQLAETSDRFEEELARGMQTVGTIHLFEYNKDEALYYFNKTIPIYERTNQQKSANGLLNNCGVVYMDAALKQKRDDYYDSALFYFNQVIDRRDNSHKSTVMNALGNAGHILIVKEDFVSAKEMFDDWDQLEKENPNPSSRAMNYGNVATMYRELGEFDKSEEYYQKGLQHAIDLGMKFEQMEYYKSLALLKEMQREYKRALEFANRGTAMKDSIYEIEKATAINELETKYQVAKKEQEIFTAKTELEQKERLQFFLIVIISLVVCFSLFTVVWIKQRHKLKQELLSQEIDNLRFQINNYLKEDEDQESDLDITIVNKDLNKPISDREFEILQLAMTNINNREIAEKAFVSVNTVKFHLKNIYTKLGVTNRKEAVEVILNRN
ncbi:MAG: LuxR C-terminal-related transcriptional regulator [bacterium]|nr:LuxR C-terminal-related transcriptional regulator [bacterium]